MGSRNTVNVSNGAEISAHEEPKPPILQLVEVASPIDVSLNIILNGQSASSD
jgi:hypothetical protein